MKRNFFRRLFIGSREADGLLARTFLYAVLAGLGFIYLYPVFYMLATSFMSSRDLVDASVTWIPRSLSVESFQKAALTLDYLNGLQVSLLMSLVPAVLQTVSLAFSGYGLARFDLPFKKLWFALIVLVFLIPSAVTLIPRYILFNGYHLVGTVWPTMLTAMLGQGIKSSVFLLIYYQFFQSYPKALDEAAMIDGANSFKVFIRVAVPMAIPAIVTTMLFSFIWFWNETAQLSLLSGAAARTLPVRLTAFVESFSKLYPYGDVGAAGALNEAISLAGTLLCIAPLMAVYILLQKHFVQSIERTGITGE